MSVLGHVAIGVVTARAITKPGPEPGVGRLAVRMTALATLALLPDIDFVARALVPGVPLFDHRGFTHSLVFAALVGLVVGWVLLVTRSDRPFAWAALAAAVVASHGLLDLIGDSELGVELLWPFSTVRLIPLQLLPDPALAPPLLQHFLVPLAEEAVLFLPAWLYAFTPRSLLPRAIRNTGR